MDKKLIILLLAAMMCWPAMGLSAKKKTEAPRFEMPTKGNNFKLTHGIIVRLWYGEWPMCIYTPPGYWLDKNKTYPVLYLLSGTGDDDLAWLQSGGASQILDELIEQKKIEPMIVVMPYVDAEQDGRFERRFPDLMEFVEHYFRVSKVKRHRAIAGLSIGGFHAMHISHRYPNMFNYVGIFSAIYTTKKMEIFNKDVDKLFVQDETVPEVFRHVDEELARQFAKPPKVYYIAVGNVDFLYRQNILYKQYLDEHGYPYTYHESKGGHSWTNWSSYLEQFLPLLFRK